MRKTPRREKYVYDWPRPMVTVDTVVFALDRGTAKVLLIKRGKEPFKGCWSLPGGFVAMDEELEAAAARELAEETSLAGIKLRQLRVFGKCGRDPRGRNISVVFTGIAEETARVKAGDDAAKAKWFDVSKLPSNMGFDHKDVVAAAMGRLKRTRLYMLKVK